MNHAYSVQAPHFLASSLPKDGASPLLWGPRPHQLFARRALAARLCDPYASDVERFLVAVARPTCPPVTLTVDGGGRPLSPAFATTGPNPNAAYHARRTLTLVLEVWARRRPPTHLDRLLGQSAARYTEVVAVRMKARDVRSARLYSMRIYHPHPDAAEVSAVCVINQRPRALAARFERCAEGPAWRCRTLQVG